MPCVPLTTAAAANSTAPVTALSAKPIHIGRAIPPSAASGTPDATPSTRRSSTALAPTTSARPSVCSVRIPE
jgi:hypothetical protein